MHKNEFNDWGLGGQTEHDGCAGHEKLSLERCWASSRDSCYGCNAQQKWASYWKSPSIFMHFHIFHEKYTGILKGRTYHMLNIVWHWLQRSKALENVSTSLLLTFCSCLSFTKKRYDKTLGDLVFDAFKYSNHDLLVKVQDPNSGFMRALLVPTRLATRPLRWPIGRWTQKTIQDSLTCFWFGLLGVHVILITGDVARTCKDNLNLLIQESHAMPHSISQHMKTFSICTRWFLANQQLIKEARNVVGFCTRRIPTIGGCMVVAKVHHHLDHKLAGIV